MADIKYNTMRFLTDEFNPYIRQALLVAKNPIDLSNFNRLDQITVQGNQPEGSKRRFLFKMNDKIYKFDGQSLVEYSGEVTLSNVLADGNSAAQIEAVRNNRQLVGKPIFPIIALYTEVQDAPTAKLVFMASFAQEVLDYEMEKAQMRFGSYYVDEHIQYPAAKILGIDVDSTIVGNASANVLIRLLQNNEWTNYMDIEDARGQIATAYQYKLCLHVDAADGHNSAKINRVYTHSAKEFDSLVFGDVAYIYSKTKYCVRNLSHAVLVVRHEDLDGGSLEADVSFQITRVKATNVGVGTIGNAEITLSFRKNIFPWSLKVYLDGVETTDYTFDTAGSDGTQITFPAKEGRGVKHVTADYTYNCEEEIWLPMTRDKTQPTGNGLYSTRFSLPNPDFDSAKLTTSIIRIKLIRARKTTNISETGSGSNKYVSFTHTPDDYVCDADFYDFDYDTNTLTFSHPSGQPVNISYDWHGKTPVVLGWSVVWSA